MCRVLSVSRSGYYRWRNRPESQRAIENRRLDVHIKAIFNRHKGRCGSPKIADELNDMGFPISKNRVARRMKAIGLRSIYRRKYRTTTDSKHSHPVADNLLQRNFTTDGPDKVWVSDITYIATARGWLYLTVFIDLFSRMVVGWALSSSLSAEMVLTALSRAIRNRRPGAGLIIHSDRIKRHPDLRIRPPANSQVFRYLHSPFLWYETSRITQDVIEPKLQLSPVPEDDSFGPLC